jgi:PAS domain S-box-containing protein
MNEVVHERAREIAVGMVKAVLDTGRPLRNLELPGVTRSDPPEERVWLVNADPIMSNGKAIAAIGVMQNITKVRQMERDAQQRLDVIDSLYRDAPIGLFHFGPDLRYQRVNEMVAAINGVSIEDHVGKTLSEVHPGLGPQAEEALRELLTERRSVRDREVTARSSSDSGRGHTYRVSVGPLRAADGSSLGLLGTVLDVTERARAEGDLKAANQRIAEQLEELERLYKHTPLAICDVDRELRIRRGNPVMARAFGLGVEEMIGQRIRELNPTLISQIDPPINRLLATGQQQLNVEIRGAPPSKPDRDYHWLMNLHPTFGAAGEVDGMIMTAQDITTLKRQQAALEVVEARLVEAQRITRIGSWEWDLRSDTLWWSVEMYRLFGKSPRHFEPTWNRFIEFVHPDDVLKLRSQIQATLERDEPYWLDLRIQLDDLSVRTLRSAARTERDADGSPARLLGTCQEALPGDEPPPGEAQTPRHRPR